MPIPPGIALIAESEVSTLISGLDGPQTALVTADQGLTGPRYVQLPATFDAPPLGEDIPNTTRKPPHRAIGWPAVKTQGYSPPVTMRASVSVSEYQSPSREGETVSYTPGWFVEAEVAVDETVYQRRFDGAGPETFATSSWLQIT